MTLHKTYGVRAGEQVTLDVANKQAAETSAALREREHAAAAAAARAVERVLKGTGGKPRSDAKALRAPAARRKD